MRPFEPVFRRLPPSGLSSNKHKSVHALRRELSICLFSLENVWRYSRKRTRAKALYVVIQIQMETLLVVNVLPHLRAAFVVSTCGMQPLGAVGFLGNAFLLLFLFLDLLFLRVILLFYLITKVSHPYKSGLK